MPAQATMSFAPKHVHPNNGWRRKLALALSALAVLGATATTPAHARIVNDGGSASGAPKGGCIDTTRYPPVNRCSTGPTNKRTPNKRPSPSPKRGCIDTTRYPPVNRCSTPPKPKPYGPAVPRPTPKPGCIDTTRYPPVNRCSTPPKPKPYGPEVPKPTPKPTTPTAPPGTPVIGSYLGRTWPLNRPCRGTFHKEVGAANVDPNLWREAGKFLRLEVHGIFETLVYRQVGVKQAVFFVSCTNSSNFRLYGSPKAYVQREIRYEFNCWKNCVLLPGNPFPGPWKPR